MENRNLKVEDSAFPVPLANYNPNEDGYKTPLELLQSGTFVKCAAPMVRYSKLPFRLLCRRWGCDLTYTPMIVSKDFNSSPHARTSEFIINSYDRPLVAQFAASNAQELSDAAVRVAKYCDAIDINCGCPQKWVMAEGYGGSLLKNPELIKDMIHTTKEKTNLPCSIKIRVDDDLKNTIELVKRAESVGVAWITVHGRTVKQRSNHPVNYEAIKLVKENLSIPVMANGDIFSLQDALDVREKTKVNGVMAARGLLQNPALYGGYSKTPIECVMDWLDICSQLGIPFFTVHQHLMYMLFESHSRSEKREFNNLTSFGGIIDFFSQRGVSFDTIQLPNRAFPTIQ